MGIQVKVLGFGNKKDTLSKEIDHYSKLLRPFASLDVTYLKNSQLSGVQALEKEEKLMMDKWGNGVATVALAEEGQLYTSHQFAHKLSNLTERSKTVVFNIGSAYGLSENVKKSSDEIISLSPMTMPYRICLIVLIEQIYRAFTIINGHPYHKA